MEVFISYSTKDSTIANAVCAALENSGIGCFIAPRDIHPGLSYASEIIRGINEVKAFLVIISSNSNASEHVANEVEIAFNAKKIIIPFFVENVPMSLELKYYLSRKHWLIAYPHYEQQLPNLVKVISELLGVGDPPASSDKDNNIKTENGIANAENGKPDGVEDCPPALRGTSAAEGVNDSPSTDDGETVVGNSSGSVILSASEPSVDARRGQSQESPKKANKEILHSVQNDKHANPVILSASEESYKHSNREILPPSGRQNDKHANEEILHSVQNDNSGNVKSETGKSDGVDDCPPVVRGTSAAEGVNDSPSTDDGETVVGDTVISSASEKSQFSGSCHPERSEPSVDARRGQSQGTHKHANREILPPSGRQNDNGGEMRDESGEVKDESGEWRDEREGLGGTFKKKWAIIIAVLVLAALLGTLSGGGSDDTAAQTSGTINGYDYVDLGLSVKWATCNVGASKPESYGNHYAWGEVETKDDYASFTSFTYGKQIYNIAGNPEYDVACEMWGDSWRLPTEAEFQELIDNCTWEWSTRNGHNGYKVTSKKNGNSIFLPAAGWRYLSSSSNQGSYGYYWSATPYESDTDGAYDLNFSEGGRGTRWDYRSDGYSVRPVSE